MRRIENHPILGRDNRQNWVEITVDGVKIKALEGEPIAAALLAWGKDKSRLTPGYNHPRGIFCAIGRCTDCVMIVDGVPGVRTCVTPVKDQMEVKTQTAHGNWSDTSGDS